MTVVIKKLNESYIKIKGYDEKLLRKLKDKFSFYTPNYRFHPRYKSGIWNGKISLFNLRNDTIPLGLSRLLYKTVKSYTSDIICDFSIFDNGYKTSEQEILEFYKNLKLPFDMYDHQLEAIYKCMNNSRLTIESATGSGKSLDLFMICNLLKIKNENEKILILVPTTQLVEQMYSDFAEYTQNWDKKFTKNIHRLYSGYSKDIDFDKTFITISTWQSMKNLDKQILKEYTSVITDECHIIFKDTDETKVVNELIHGCINAKNKYGFSGSIPDEYYCTIQLNSLFGPLERIVNAKELIELDILAKFDVKPIVLSYNVDKKIELKNQIDLIKNDAKNASMKKYRCEVDFLKQLDEKYAFITKFCSKLNKNSIIMFKSREVGNKVYKELFKLKDKRVYYIDGSTLTSKREEIRQNMEKYDNCLLVGSLGTVSTGINIKNVYNVVLIESFKAETKLIQTIGRTLRKLEGKKSTLYDLVDDLSLNRWSNYSIRHFRTRAKIYKKEGHKISIKKIRI